MLGLFLTKSKSPSLKGVFRQGFSLSLLLHGLIFSAFFLSSRRIKATPIY